MTKSVLVAGGAGFIGSHLSEFLHNKQYQVTIIDSFVTGQKKNVEKLKEKGVHIIEGDIRNKEQLPTNTRFDYIYNLASPASPIDFDNLSLDIMETSAIGHRNLLQMATNQGSRVLFASTSEVYGDPLVHPQVESYRGNVNTIGPRSCYDEGKRYGETLTYHFKTKHRLETRIARIFNTYGPKMRLNDGRVIPNFFCQALKNQSLTIFGTGLQTRSLCYVSDMVNGLYKLMNSNVDTPVNIGNPVEMTILDVANEVNRITGNKQANRHLPLPKDDPLIRKPNITKALEQIDWKPEVELATGFHSTLEYFKQEVFQ